jgi:nucleolar protein 58
MIVQAIGLLDELDKEINTYAMRMKEWYGWHFPELTKVINDNLVYAQIILKMKTRVNANTSDFSDILLPDIETQLKEAALVSMGTDISQEDCDCVSVLAEQV